MIGISNIMLVIVRDQTKEFGIRKSIGATPSSIIRFVLLESLIITISSGVSGMIIGFIIVFFTNMIMSLLEPEDFIITNLPIDYPIIFMSFVMIIVAGIIAGLYPAIKAAKTPPLHAIRSEF